jgi:hypothetical protein
LRDAYGSSSRFFIELGWAASGGTRIALSRAAEAMRGRCLQQFLSLPNGVLNEIDPKGLYPD